MVQVSLLGLQIILNQKEAPTDNRPGCGRAFLDVDENQIFKWRQAHAGSGTA